MYVTKGSLFNWRGKWIHGSDVLRILGEISMTYFESPSKEKLLEAKKTFFDNLWKDLLLRDLQGK